MALRLAGALTRVAAGAVAGLMVAVMLSPTQVAAAPACPPLTNAATRAAAWAIAPTSGPRPGSVIRGERMLPPTTGACHDAGMAQLQKAIAATLADGGIVLLGEVHDNGEQHALRGELIAEAARGLGRRPAVVMEHFRANQKLVLDRFQESGQAGETDKLFEVTDWRKSGWPDEALFRPMIGSILSAKLEIRAGDPPRDMVRLIARQGLESMSDEERRSLGMSASLPAPLEDALLTELEASHCGLMPKSVFGKLALAQRYRDAHQARAASRAAKDAGSAFLLAGNGHVRADRAVPWHLRRLDPDRKILTVMLTEVSPGKAPEQHVPRDPEGRPAADFLVLTPGAARPDPCVAMREMFSKPRK